MPAPLKKPLYRRQTPAAKQAKKTLFNKVEIVEEKIPKVELEHWKAELNSWTNEWEVYHKHELLVPEGTTETNYEQAGEVKGDFWVGPAFKNDFDEYLCAQCKVQDMSQPPEQLITLMNLQKLRPQKRPQPVFHEQGFYISGVTAHTGTTMMHTLPRSITRVQNYIKKVTRKL